jgi:hypothetical protein
LDRDDIENLERMYYHLICAVGRRWERDRWIINYDENSDFKWDNLVKVIEFTRRKKDDRPTVNAFEPREVDRFSIDAHQEFISQNEPIGWVADIFAGLAHFSRSIPVAVLHVLNQPRDRNKKQLGLDEQATSLSLGENSKARVLTTLNNGCKERKLGVSLRSFGYLKTLNPENRVNFWEWLSQHARDKAPTRMRESEPSLDDSLISDFDDLA